MERYLKLGAALTIILLRGMGYKTRITPRGPDRGKDVIVSPDGLDLEDPRIMVEVKYRNGQMGSSGYKKFYRWFAK